LPFSIRYANDGCLRFTQDTFHALEAILPALTIFANLTFRYTTVEANAHRILLDLHLALQQLQKMQRAVPPNRQPSFDAAIQKLRKYMNRMLSNDWICAAFALDANVKEAGLVELFEFYELEGRTSEVLVRAIEFRTAAEFPLPPSSMK
jgi:hypothetical protein